MDHEYTQGMTTQEALRSAFEVGATSGAQAQKEKDLASVESTRMIGMSIDAEKEAHDWACDEIERQIKGL